MFKLKKTVSSAVMKQTEKKPIKNQNALQTQCSLN